MGPSRVGRRRSAEEGGDAAEGVSDGRRKRRNWSRVAAETEGVEDGVVGREKREGGGIGDGLRV